eukprot:15481660-Alexandrium_andersonii.AAC.1
MERAERGKPPATSVGSILGREGHALDTRAWKRERAICARGNTTVQPIMLRCEPGIHATSCLG